MQDSEPRLDRSFLVTGVSGLLGLNLAKCLRASGVGLNGTSWRHEVRLHGLQCFSCDLREADQAMALIEQLRPSVFIHCAAATDVDWCERNPEQAFSINAHPCSYLASALNKVGATFVLISTDSVFDGRTGQYEESCEPGPLNVYATSKLTAERLVSTLAERWLIIRTNIYGWNGQKKNSLAEWIYQELSAGRAITGFEDVVFAPLLTSDLAPLILAMVESNLQGLYHCGASHAVSKYDFARRLAGIYGFDATLVRPGKLAGAKLGAPRPLNTSLLSRKLEADLSRKLPSIEDGLKRFRDQGMNGWAQQLKKHIL
jgi:dTDP-4-dehydrorhamnose reductase